MANHFTPEELAEELGTETRDVVQFCVREGIPIYKGKIDRSLLTAVMKAKGVQLSKTQVAAV
jgi:maleate cis-trans isomerase